MNYRNFTVTVYYTNYVILFILCRNERNLISNCVKFSENDEYAWLHEIYVLPVKITISILNTMLLCKSTKNLDLKVSVHAPRFYNLTHER